ncbi:drug/metabolite transporter (DMT)-like permease [Methylohalomonas lacus]|uniref:Drug/metabolite transporter (DMT)-like permease n=1 Tax=Methylohalomonas lacus TaxID=398773 RepID=A0AAE3HLB4_9GAMM|nr:DMT family transporter [Methylohalomonas lacus]MCS3904431.1 drug/metabolite transporter (DMT)-like permease [Methylohalomonas lacus]
MMHVDWLSLALLCAIAVASADALTKRFLGGYRAMEIVLLRFTLSGLLLAPILLFVDTPEFTPEFLLILAAMLPCEILAMLLYMKAIRDYPLALTLPYLSFTPVIITVCAFVFLGERVTGLGLTGILLVVAGGYLLNLDSVTADGSGPRLLEPFRAAFSNRGSQLMLVVAALYSITAVLGKAAMNQAPPLFFAAFYYVLLGLGSLILAWLWKPASLRGCLRRPGAGLLLAALMAIMVITHFLALDRVETAYMITVKRTSLLFGMLYGAWLFSERHLPQHLVAGGLMVLGIFCIYYGQPIG